MLPPWWSTTPQYCNSLSKYPSKNGEQTDSQLVWPTGFSNGSLYEINIPPTNQMPCWRPCKWLWQANMTSRCRRHSEVYLPLHSSLQIEPLIQGPPKPTLDEGVSSMGGHIHGDILWVKTFVDSKDSFQNINGLFQKDKGEIKLHMLRQCIYQHEIDRVGIAETNMCWLVKIHAMVATKIMWLVADSTLVIRINCMDKVWAIYQPQGTSLLVINSIAHWVQSSGDDPSGMGQWWWAKLQGRGNHFTHIVIMDCPCKGRGPTTTYQQTGERSCPSWLRHLSKTGDTG